MSELKAGFARLDITPPLGVCLGGYFFQRRAEGVLDPLYVNALAFSDGERTAVVMACDLLGIYNTFAREWPRQIAAELGLPAEALFVCHTHTHTGPVIGEARDPSDPQYDAWLYRRLRDAAVMAINDCKPVLSVRAHEGDCKGVTFNRRFKMKGGYYQTWATYCDPDIEAYAGVNDESMRFVRMEREGGDELVLINFQDHPDNISGNLISADYVGFLRSRIEAEKPGTKCIFFDGAEGQMSAADWWHDSVIRIGYEKARWMGHTMADHVLKHFDQVQPVEGTGVAMCQTMVNCRTKRDSSRIPEAERLIALHEAGRDDDIGPDWVCTPLVAEAYVLKRLEAADLSEVPMLVSAVSVGGLAFLGIAGEPFCEIGKHIRDNSPYAMTFVCCQTNGCEGYYPTAESYDQGGYEPRNTRFPKGIGEILMDAGDEALKKLANM